MKEKKLTHKSLAIVMSVALVLMLIGVSFAYYLAQITGEGKEVSVSSAYKELTISDNNAVSFGTITPGWSESVNFSVTNTGDVATYYNLIWKDLTNGLSRTSDLTVTITSTNNGGSGSNLTLPGTGNNLNIISDIMIEPNVTQTYTLTFTYANLADIDQSVDSGKTISGHLGISPSTKKVEQ